MSLDIRNIRSEIDLRLNMLAGDPMVTDKIVVHPLSLKEINQVGYSEFYKYLNFLTLDHRQLPEGANAKNLYTLVLSSGDDDLISNFIFGICLFLKQDVSRLRLHHQLGLIFNSEELTTDFDVNQYVILNEDNFSDFIQILKYQNCLSDTNVQYEPPASEDDERVRKIKERLNKGKEIVAEVKNKKSQKTGNDLDFADIVSAVSTKSNTYNKQNVWELTLYQLYDEFKRLEAVSSYETNILAMVQGAKIDNLRHWSSKLD